METGLTICAAWPPTSENAFQNHFPELRLLGIDIKQEGLKTRVTRAMKGLGWIMTVIYRIWTVHLVPGHNQDQGR